MAKLTNVKYPSEIVEIGGVTYRKVERKARAGDIVRELTDGPDTTKGAFYEVVKRHVVGFYDDVDDFRTPTLSAPRFEVYEKVTEPAAPQYREVKRWAEVGERIRIGLPNRPYVVLEPVEKTETVPQPERLTVGDYAKVTSDVTVGGCKRSEVKIGEIRKIVEVDGSNIPFKAEQLDGKDFEWFREDALIRATEDEVAAAKKAAERAKAIGTFADGGYAVIKPDADGYFNGVESGSYVEVRPTIVPGPYALEIKRPRSGYNGGFCNADALRKVTKEEYEEATNPKPNVSVGDKVRITRYQCNWPEGTVVTITEPDVGGVGKTARAMSEDGRIFLTDYDSFELLSAEELAQIAEEAKWAKIGRKVNEFKAGDIVQITANTNGSVNKVGSYGEVAEGLSMTGSYRVETGAGSVGNLTRPDDMRLIVPVEQRFDMQKEAA